MARNFDTLSDRQMEILGLLGQHFQVKEVAHRLGISEKTVRNHIDEARRRLGGLSMREAIRLIATQAETRSLGQNSLYRKNPISGTSDESAASGHEHEPSTERKLSDHQLRGTSGGLAYVGDTRQGSGGRDHDPGVESPQHEDGASENDLLNGGGHGLADDRGGRRWIALKRWLNERSTLQWCGLIIASGAVLGLGLSAVFTVMIATIQAINILAGIMR